MIVDFNSIKAEQLARMREAFGELVEYRADGFAIQLRAIVGKTVTQTHTDSGLVVVAHVRDFMIGVCDLVDSAGELIVPDRRHRLCRVTRPGKPVFQVAPESAGMDCWRYSDGGETQYRVHTKAIGKD